MPINFYELLDDKFIIKKISIKSILKLTLHYYRPNNRIDQLNLPTNRRKKQK